MENFSKKKIVWNRLKHLNLYQSTFETSRVHWMQHFFLRSRSRYGKEKVLLAIFYSRRWTVSNIINIHFLWHFASEYSWLKNWLVGCHRDTLRCISDSNHFWRFLRISGIGKLFKTSSFLFAMKEKISPIFKTKDK